MSQMKQYEHKIVMLNQPTPKQLEDHLNEMGKKGWVLTDSFGNCRFVFTREIRAIGPTEFKTMNETDIVAPL